MRKLINRAPLATPLAVLLALVIASAATAVAWSPRVRLTTSGNGMAGGLVTLGASTAVAVYELGPDVFVKRSTNSGVNWGSKLRVSRLNKGGDYPDIDGRDNFVDVVWHEDDADNPTTVRYVRSTNSGASYGSSVELASLHKDDWTIPRVGRGANNVVAVAWFEGMSASIKVRVSTDGGVSFGAVQTLSGVTTTYDPLPAVAVGNGVIYVAYYTDNDTVKVRRSVNDGASWLAATTIANNASIFPNLQALTITAVGSKAYVGFTVDDGSHEWTRYRQTTNSGSSWAGQRDISPPGTNPSIIPTLTLRGGVLYGAYSQCFDSACNNTKVMYRSRPSSGSWSAPAQASHAGADWADPVGVGKTGRVIVLYTADNGGTSPYEPNSDVYVRTGT